MDEKNFGIVLDALAVAIKELKLTISLKDFEIENLKKELEAAKHDKN